MDVPGAILCALLGVITATISFKMQKEQRGLVSKRLSSINHGLVDNMPVKVAIFAGLLIGFAVGLFFGVLT